MRKSIRRGPAQGTNTLRHIVMAMQLPVLGTAAPDFSRTARVRLEMLDWHRAHGACVSRTARHFGFSRPTVYRWLERLDCHRLESLKDRSDRPVRGRRPTWTTTQLCPVKTLRKVPG